MATLAAPLFPVAPSLAEELHVNVSNLGTDAISHLEGVVNSVAEKTEFTNTRFYLLMAPVLSLVSFSFSAATFFTSSPVAAVIFAMISLVFIMTTYQHRHAGKEPFMYLTRTHLWVSNLSAPIELTDIISFKVKTGEHMVEILTLKAGVKLPKARYNLRPFASRATFRKGGSNPILQIFSAGLKANGKRLDGRRTAHLFDGYLRAAQAAREIEILRAQRASVN
jgi:hypothetical protein